MKKYSVSGYTDKNNFSKLIRYLPAVEFEVSPKQQPIDILRLRRIYNKQPDNYWFHSRNKIKEWIKVKITVELEGEDNGQEKRNN